MGTDPPISTQELTEALRGVLNLLAWQTQLVQGLLKKIEPGSSLPGPRRTKASPKKQRKLRKGGDARD